MTLDRTYRVAVTATREGLTAPQTVTLTRTLDRRIASANTRVDGRGLSDHIGCIASADPRYCPLALAGETHNPHEHMYMFGRGITGRYHCDGAGLSPYLYELHHGDCVGGDAEAHAIAVSLGYASRGHPPQADSMRAHCWPMVEVAEPKPYLARNHDLVDVSHELLALPDSPLEKRRGSGTWATIRYARKIERALTIIWPDGTTTEERP